MAGTASEDSAAVGRSLEENSSGQQRYQDSEALAEWRSSEQVENGLPSTSPPYWDSDDDTDDCGLKPSELYYKYTWKIEKFSQINKRELKSNVFEVGGYRWYILIYPQGCDVCNHLSLFLCVANHDKLLPGWSHFAQFTIAVINKDPKKSKYSDTLHRFWKKEHDWGWKKFMELSKMLDGFIDADTLIIKAQVQVIRERADRPFRCLDRQYRRELVRVYLSSVEQICRRFVEERRSKLGKLIEDKARWSSFCAFWCGIDQNARRRMSREKTDLILKVVVKHFFIDKEVNSTLVMDSLYSGLKALEGQTKSKRISGKCLSAEELPIPMVCMEKDTFVLVDDVLLLLERAALEPLPPKDDKGPQNRTKEGGSGEDFSRDSIERDERRLTELGRRTIEIFVLTHIFSSKIEVAYQEAVALKRQEELIREEEAAWIAVLEQKTRRGAVDKEKKSKKKQGKHKLNSRKGKDKGKDEKAGVVVEDEPEIEEAEPVGKPHQVEDVSDVSDSVDCVSEKVQPDSEDRDSSPVDWYTDTSEVNLPKEASSSLITGTLADQNGGRMSLSSVMDDSSSTCSTDSMPSANGAYKGNALLKSKIQKSPSRGRNQQGYATHEAAGWATDANSKLSNTLSYGRQVHFTSESCKVPESEAVVPSSLHNGMGPEKHVTKKEEDIYPEKEMNAMEGGAEKLAKLKIIGVPSSPRSPPKNSPPVVMLKLSSSTTAADGMVSIRKSSSESPIRAADKTSANSTDTVVMSKAYAHKSAIPKSAENSMPLNVPISTANSMAQPVPVLAENPKVHNVFGTAERPVIPVSLTNEKPTVQQVVSRPLSAPLVPVSRPPAPVVSMVQSAPSLSWSASAAGRLAPEPSPASSSYVGQSYRNAMMGNHVTMSSSSYTQLQSSNLAIGSSVSHSRPSASLPSAPVYFNRMDPKLIRPSLSFGMVNLDPPAESSRSINHYPSMQNNMQSRSQWIDSHYNRSSRSISSDPSFHNDMQNIDIYNPVQSRYRDQYPVEFPAGTSGHQNHSVLAEEFPHLDIINDLLDDQHGIGLAAGGSSGIQSLINGPQHLNRQLTFPGDIGMSGNLHPSTSSCRVERSHSYQDNKLHHNNYNSVGAQFVHLNLNPQANLHPYPDGLAPNQWQVGGSDLSYLGMRISEDDGLLYHNIPNYSNLSIGLYGDTVFQPSNGH